MPLRYKRLWITLAEHDMKKSDLNIIADISSNVISKMTNNQPISLTSIEKICLAFNCHIEDVVEVVQSEEVQI